MSDLDRTMAITRALVATFFYHFIQIDSIDAKFERNFKISFFDSPQIETISSQMTFFDDLSASAPASWIEIRIEFLNFWTSC